MILRNPSRHLEKSLCALIRASFSSLFAAMLQRMAESQQSSSLVLLDTLKTSAQTFLLPPPKLHAAALQSLKFYLDPVAVFTSETQSQRQEASRRKRKRGETAGSGARQSLRLREVYVDGFDVEQVWEQARRVLDATTAEVARLLERHSHKHQESNASDTLAQEDTAPNVSDTEMIDGDEGISLDFMNGSLNEFSDSASDDQDSDASNSQSEAGTEKDHMFEEDEAGISDEEIDLKELSEDTFIPDKLGLNDGFFSIDDFNRQSDFLERQDTKGENDGAASDEEDVDWGVDPLTTNISRRRKHHNLGDDTADEESEDEKSGPTFGNVDLNGPDMSESDIASDHGVHVENFDPMNNTNDIRYADFFAHPPRKASKSTRRRPLPKTQPQPLTALQKSETEDDIQRTISVVRRDIFEDDLTPDEDAPDEDGANRSSHQKRQAALKAEIRRLEAAAVAKRDWTLSGEARAVDRPLNSLLEEDLDFERTGKPVPIITQEVSEDIEALIKRRILAREFDEVIRRRPDNLATGGQEARRGKIELDDTKPQQSLAEVYEAEQLKINNPEGYVDKRDEKLKREHAKIEAMWRDVSAKLDALSSWHYKPKPPSATITVVADVPTISMEDARPAAGGEAGGESMLAPQEVYKAGEARDKKVEVVTGSGLPVGREEMTRDEKTRRRRREKERIRKAGGFPPMKSGKQVSGRAKDKQGIIGDLKKGQVRVIGKKGDIKDVEGKSLMARGSIGTASATKFKL